MIKNRTSYILAVAIIIFIIILIVNFSHRPKENTKTDSSTEVSVESFVECQNAGYPTTSAYPKQCTAPNGIIFVEDLSPSTATSSPTTSATSTEMVYKDLIKVSNLKSSDSIKSPLHLKGEARGNWYFEASFPIKVTDQAGLILGTSHAEALGEWMTTSYVPFAANISFTNTKGATSGYIILEKDNASGLPEHDDSFKIPVRFEK